MPKMPEISFSTRYVINAGRYFQCTVTTQAEVLRGKPAGETVLPLASHIEPLRPTTVRVATSIVSMRANIRERRQALREKIADEYDRGKLLELVETVEKSLGEKKLTLVSKSRKPRVSSKREER